MSDFHVFENYWSENFATSLLVFALRRSQEFASKFLEEVLRRSGNGPYETYRVTEVERDCQISLPEPSGLIGPEVRRPDIRIGGWVDGRSFLVLVEAKIGAGWQANQLPAYLKWLTAQGKDVWRLVTLTRDQYAGSEPQAKLVWSDLIPLIEATASRCEPSSFEAGFWKQLEQHLEEVMQTFTGFSPQFTTLRQLMREIDLFLIGVLRAMGAEKWGSDGRRDSAGYYVTSKRAMVGFHWDERFPDPTGRDLLVVEKEGRQITIASLAEVVEDSQRYKAEGRLGEFIDLWARKILRSIE
jgi:hypothetical protein